MKIPKDLSYESAAALPVGGMTALQLLRKAGTNARDRVLVYGASGSVGTYAVQLSVQMGATVTGVCSRGNLDLVRSLGTAAVVDYAAEDVTQRGERYDVVIDAVGKFPRSRAKRVLAPGGRTASVKSPTKETLDDLTRLAELASEGKLKAVIDRRYPLSEIVEAHRYVESRRKKGNVVITVGSGNTA
jgi:NADPH:quinone reductase-like Zn-dependent oxidoreductase